MQKEDLITDYMGKGKDNLSDYKWVMAYVHGNVKIQHQSKNQNV